MADCVFDIETAALPEAQIPRSFVTKLKEQAEPDDPEGWRDRLGLYALSAQVVVIALLNPQSHRGEVLYDDRHGTLDAIEMPEGVEATLVGGSEAEIVEHFWKRIARYDRVVTYNGRGFDVPFMMQRALVHSIPVTVDLMPPRFHRRTNHLDLQEVLSQYRATRPYGLGPWTEAVGASSPKEGEVSGAGVGEAFEAGRTREIAEYCLRDVAATNVLLEKVQRYWSPLIG
jgi:DNA polymerase elongation subunit (family B)